MRSMWAITEFIFIGIEVDTYNTALMDLGSGVCDGLVVDSGLANYLAIENEDLKLLNKSIAGYNH